MIPYKYHSGDNYWDLSLLNDLLQDPRFTTEQGDGCLYMVGGEYAKVKDVNEAIKDYKWVLLLLHSDEQSKFEVEDINHPNIKIYIQTPKQGRHDKYGKWPLGYTSETRKYLELKDKDIDYFFSGQITHPRRRQCYEQLQKMKGGLVEPTQGFAQGSGTDKYMDHMCRSKVTPCPSGPVTCESFRLYESLEAGSIPIADNVSTTSGDNYWDYMFTPAPFPTIKDYSDLPGYTEDQLKDFQSKANRLQAWWIKKKRDLKEQLISDVEELSGKKYQKAITAVIPVSPIPSHPDIKILEETINSIKTHLDCEIIITFDGVREEQEDRKEDYEEFIRKALFKCNTEWRAVPIIFKEHMHQSGMMKAVIDEIKTPLLMYVEQDTPLTTDMEIDFKGISQAIFTGQVSLIRFSHEAHILDDYNYLMLDGEPITISGVPLVRTAQYSQRPHVASVAFYKQLLSHFSDDSRTMIEDRMHSVVWEAYKLDGVLGWQNYRLAIYHPEGNIKRSYHTDGRAGGEKYVDQYTF